MIIIHLVSFMTPRAVLASLPLPMPLNLTPALPLPMPHNLTPALPLPMPLQLAPALPLPKPLPLPMKVDPVFTTFFRSARAVFIGRCTLLVMGEAESGWHLTHFPSSSFAC